MSANIDADGKRSGLLETIEKREQLSRFAQLLSVSAVAEMFDEPGQFTVFAPTNEAFESVPDSEIENLISERGQVGLRRLLSYHILPSRRTAAAISGLHSSETVAGPNLRFNDQSGLRVNDAVIGLRNIEAVNGVVHIINKVLLPPPYIAVAPAGSLL